MRRENLLEHEILEVIQGFLLFIFHWLGSAACKHRAEKLKRVLKLCLRLPVRRKFQKFQAVTGAGSLTMAIFFGRFGSLRVNIKCQRGGADAAKLPVIYSLSSAFSF